MLKQSGMKQLFVVAQEVFNRILAVTAKLCIEWEKRCSPSVSNIETKESNERLADRPQMVILEKLGSGRGFCECSNHSPYCLALGEGGRTGPSQFFWRRVSGACAVLAMYAAGMEAPYRNKWLLFWENESARLLWNLGCGHDRRNYWAGLLTLTALHSIPPGALASASLKHTNERVCCVQLLPGRNRQLLDQYAKHSQNELRFCLENCHDLQQLRTALENALPSRNTSTTREAIVQSCRHCLPMLWFPEEARRRLHRLYMVWSSALKMGITAGHALLCGHDGSGRVAAVRSLAEAAGYSCMDINGGVVASSFLGQAEKRLRTIFSLARRKAPTVLIIRDIDVLCGRTRQLNGNESGPQSRILSTLLNELDGVQLRGNVSSAPVFVVGTAQIGCELDAALLRAGRLAVHIKCPLPTAKERATVLRKWLLSPKSCLQCELHSDIKSEVAEMLCKHWKVDSLSSLTAKLAERCEAWSMGEIRIRMQEWITEALLAS